MWSLWAPASRGWWQCNWLHIEMSWIQRAGDFSSCLDYVSSLWNTECPELLCNVRSWSLINSCVFICSFLKVENHPANLTRTRQLILLINKDVLLLKAGRLCTDGGAVRWSQISGVTIWWACDRMTSCRASLTMRDEQTERGMLNRLLRHLRNEWTVLMKRLRGSSDSRIIPGTPPHSGSGCARSSSCNMKTELTWVESYKCLVWCLILALNQHWWNLEPCNCEGQITAQLGLDRVLCYKQGWDRCRVMSLHAEDPVSVIEV